MLYRIRKYYRKSMQKWRVFHYRLLSTNKPEKRNFSIKQPVLFTGIGTIQIDDNVIFGYFPSPSFYNGYHHIEARTKDARIEIGKGTHINNSSVIIADKASILIGEDVLIGTNFNAFSSDFHPIDPQKRKSSDYNGKSIRIHDGVFIGSNVTILKGVTIGENSVIGASSLVNCHVPANCIAVGNPIKIIKKLP